MRLYSSALSMLILAGGPALNFRQGDLGSFQDARGDFTPGGWKEFVKSMAGFLDDKGAPTLSSEFVLSGTPKILRHTDDRMRLIITGTLTQTHDKSRTVYKTAEIDVEVSGKAPHIQHLTTIYKVNRN